MTKQVPIADLINEDTTSADVTHALETRKVELHAEPAIYHAIFKWCVKKPERIDVLDALLKIPAVRSWLKRNAPQNIFIGAESFCKQHDRTDVSELIQTIAKEKQRYAAR